MRQEPTTSYTVAGTTVSFVGYSISATDDVYVTHNALALQTTVPPDSSVTNAKLVDGSIATAKLADDAVTRAKMHAAIFCNKSTMVGNEALTSLLTEYAKKEYGPNNRIWGVRLFSRW